MAGRHFKQIMLCEVYAEQPDENGMPVLLGTCDRYAVTIIDLFLEIFGSVYKIGHVYDDYYIPKFVILVSTDDDPSHLQGWQARYYG